ncbi:MAG: L,D-transpeptidase [Pseudomonadota bacterium]
MSRRAPWLCVAALSLFASLAWSASAPPPDFAGEPVSDAAVYAVTQALTYGDALGRPFAIVDKREARLYVFDATGRLVGASPALLGLTPGDGSIADIAQRAPVSLAPHERSTPAGRFDSQPGHNDKGEAIVWVDYAASLAIHRLRPAPATERRVDRLASASPADNRITLGCVVVPVAFYETVVEPLLGRRRGVVYVLPESGPVQAMFAGTRFAALSR